jgi:hypothetical protein
MGAKLVFWPPRWGRFHGLGTDQLAAFAQVAGCQQAAPVACGRADKFRVGHELRPIGKGQARGLGVTVQKVG